MTTYTVTDKSTGAEIYRYQSDAPTEWTGMEFATHDHTAIPEGPAPAPEAGPRRLSKLAFIGRLQGDYRNVLAAAKVSVDVEMFVKMLDWVTPEADGTSVDLDDPRVAGGLTLLESDGLLPDGKAWEVLHG